MPIPSDSIPPPKIMTIPLATPLFVLLLTTFALLQIPRQTFAAPPQDITSIDHDRNTYLSLETQLWSRIERLDPTEAESLTAIFEMYHNFTANHLPMVLASVADSDSFIALEGIYEWKSVEQHIMGVTNLFEVIRLTLNKWAESPEPKSFERLEMLDLAETILDDSKQSFRVASTMADIENIMLTQNLYRRASLESQNQVCATRQSAQQVLYQLYSTISLTELKGYSMMQFSWMLLKSYGKGNYTREAQLMRKSFADRARKTQALLRDVMSDADRQVWRCDPHAHVEGVTYEAVTRLLQGYVENEVDMNTDQTCRENCAAYTFTENHGCFKDMYCAKQPRCSGKILNCQYVDSDMWICPSKSSSTRRYEYIEYENGRVMGQKGTCTRGTTKVDSWWRWVFWHCSYCLCMCDEPSAKSDRFFSLREATSNITANHVLTGLRFRKINRIIHLQIQEGQLLPRGAINTSTIAWRPVAEFRITDRAVRVNEDYHMMDWKNRAIDTDDLIAPDNHVVTGIRFRTVGGHLNLEIRITEADFASGKLLDLSNWVSNDNTTSRKQVTLTRPDISTRSLSKSVPTTTTNSYIEFVNTDLDADLAQSTVPFIDIQDVVSIPPVALAGAGLHHKGQKNFGGFVAPKLFTYNFAPHIEVQEWNAKKNNLKK